MPKNNQLMFVGERKTGSKHLMQWDGMKAVDLWSGDRGWNILDGPSSAPRVMNEQDYFVTVPWLYRAVKDRATTLKKVTFAIVDDKGDDVDNSGTWTNELDIFPYPRRMLHQIEESLVMTGRAYLFLETNSFGYVKAIKYLLPNTIKEKFDDNGDLLYYIRRVKGGEYQVPPENIVAIYDPDYTVEQGAGRSSAAKAALLASGVLFNADLFIAQYFQRGAIKATVLSVDTSDQKEANRLQAWWEDVVIGVKNAWTALVIRANTATPTIIGQGLEGLENDSLTKSKRQDISTAIGVPESRLWAASANFATAEVENKSYYNDVIVPECWMIEEAFNAQLFTAIHHMDGYRWEFRPEAGAGFSLDEKNRSMAYVGYVGSGMLPSVAAQLVGIELPGEMEYTDLDPKDAEEPPEKEGDNPINTQGSATNPDVIAGSILTGAKPVVTGAVSEAPVASASVAPTSKDLRSALFNWKKLALAAVKTDHSANVEYDNPAIDDEMSDFIRYELEGCKTVEDVRTIFKKAREMAEPPDPMMLLAGELRKARELLEKSRV